MIKEKDGIAVVDAAKLLDPGQRKMADTPRVIVEPTAKLKKTVSASIHFLFAAHMRKISLSSLKQILWPVLDCPAAMRAFFIHSYSDYQRTQPFKVTRWRRVLTITQNDKLSAGSDWFNLPKTVLTPQLKRDFQLLEMRSVLDQHR